MPADGAGHRAGMRPRLTASLMTLAAATIGTLGTRPGSRWYRELRQPSFQPPAVAFPLVWTPLYGSIAWSTGRAAAAREDDRGAYLALVAADLAANAGWCWAFFTGHSTRGGLATIAVLDALNLALLRQTRARDATAGRALIPYVAWCAFATALNAEHLRLNPTA